MENTKNITVELNNKIPISKFTFTQDLIAYCRVGKDYSKWKLEITVYPDKYMPDYDLLEEHIYSLNGNVGTREEIVSDIYEYIYSQLKPKRLIIVSRDDMSSYSNLELVIDSDDVNETGAVAL